MRRLPSRLAVVLALLVAAVVVPAQAALAFSDVPTDYWDYEAIQYVAVTNTWMLDFSTTKFKPHKIEERKHFARTLVAIYAPDEPIDPTITFPDLPADDPYYPYANVAVKLGWIPTTSGGNFSPTVGVTVSLFDKALIDAMGVFGSEIAGLSNIRMTDGTVYDLPGRWPEWQLARWLGFHDDDNNQYLQNADLIPRDEAAYSLWIATTLPHSEIDEASVFDDVELPDKSGDRQALTQYALDQIGYPYIWGGEWNTATSSGYCCGTQTKGGFDCSGYVWWVLKRNEDGYNAAQFHPDYVGWTVPERTSSDLARNTPTQVAYADLNTGNLMFFASDGGSSWTDVDHVGIYLGNGWMMHATTGGAQLENVSSGWYYDNFAYGRRLLVGGGAPRSGFSADLAAGDPAVEPHGSR